MKVRLNRETLKAMPEQVRAIVTDWKNHYRKTTIGVTNTTHFYTSEDARYTVINLLSGEQKTEQAAGEFSIGAATMRPGAKCEIPHGCVVIEQGFFLGKPYLYLYQAMPISNVITNGAPHNPQLVEETERATVYEGGFQSIAERTESTYSGEY